MRDTYQYRNTDHILFQEEDIDPMESDEAMEKYIERCRAEFHEEWFQYLEENDR